jgi:germination protein M
MNCKHGRRENEMVRLQSLLRRAAAGLLAVPLLLAGCSLLDGREDKMEIDPPPDVQEDGTWAGSGTQAGPGSTEEQASGAAEDAVTPVTVYVKDRGGYLAPVTVNAAADGAEEAGLRALERMIEGNESWALPEGFRGVLPAGTRIDGLTIDRERRVAIVDFGGTFTDYNPQDERRIVEAVTWTLTGLADVDGVELRHDGEPLREMPVDGFPLDGPLTRAMGINLELAPGASYGESMPVTVYFSALSDEGEPYFVPVTRLVERQEDQAIAALRELIAGPARGADLAAVMTEDVEAEAVMVDGDTAFVDLRDETYEEGQPLPAEMLQAVVLSVSENTGAEKVQIRINGSANLVDTDNRSYAEPVSRPEHVNALRT